MSSINPKFTEFFNKLGARNKNKANNEQSENAAIGREVDLDKPTTPPTKKDNAPQNKKIRRAAGK